MHRSPEALLAYEARRRPDVADLVERAESLTDAEIDAAPVLPWIRNAVRDLRAKKRSDAVAARMVAAIEAGAFDTSAPVAEPLGDMRQWTGDRTFVRVDRGGQIEMEPGELFWLPPNGGVWIGTIYAKTVDPHLLTSSTACGRITHSGYRTARREHANANCPADAPVIDLTADPKRPMTPSQNLATRFGVRIG